jgi:hypothetical protein
MGLVSLLTLAVAREPRTAAQGFEGWVAADRLFRGDPDWRGGDAAYSVDLGRGRVLWLFGDSFVGEGSGADREGLRMVRNSAAVQEGYDPETADMVFLCGRGAEGLSDYFPCDGAAWLWPGPAVRVGSVVLLTFTRLVQREKGMFGFHPVGAQGLVLTNPSSSPAEWRFANTVLPSAPPGVLFGTGSLLVYDDSVYAYPVAEPGSHDVYLARWRAGDVAAQDLSSPVWWDGVSGSWSADRERATTVAERGQTEFSVTREADGRFWMVSVEGFGAAMIVARTAPEPQGPWSDPEVVYRPPECERDGILVYSAKAHPHIPGRGPVFTYCTNHFDFATMVHDMDLYFPRFVRPRHE